MKFNSNRKNIAKIVAAASSVVLVSCQSTYQLNDVEIGFPAVESGRNGLKSNFLCFKNVRNVALNWCSKFATLKDKFNPLKAFSALKQVFIQCKAKFLAPSKTTANCKPVEVEKALDDFVVDPTFHIPKHQPVSKLTVKSDDDVNDWTTEDEALAEAAEDKKRSLKHGVAETAKTFPSAIMEETDSDWDRDWDADWE